jgi:hypothetical protein
MVFKYDLMEIARIGVLYIPGDLLEEVMPPQHRDYLDGDGIDFVETHYNTLKRMLLLTERIDPPRRVKTALWVKRPSRPELGEVMVAGRALPIEGYDIVTLWPEIERAFSGLPSRFDRSSGETVYYPVRNSDEEIVGVLEVSQLKTSYFI